MNNNLISCNTYFTEQQMRWLNAWKRPGRSKNAIIREAVDSAIAAIGWPDEAGNEQNKDSEWRVCLDAAVRRIEELGGRDGER